MDKDEHKLCQKAFPPAGNAVYVRHPAMLASQKLHVMFAGAT